MQPCTIYIIHLNTEVMYYTEVLKKDVALHMNYSSGKNGASSDLLFTVSFIQYDKLFIDTITISPLSCLPPAY